MKVPQAMTKPMQKLRYAQGEEDASNGLTHTIDSCQYYHNGWKEGRRATIKRIAEEM